MNNKRMFQWVERGESLFPEVVLRDFASEGQIPEACLLYKGKPIMVMDQCYEIFPWWKVRGRARRVAKRLDAIYNSSYDTKRIMFTFERITGVGAP